MIRRHIETGQRIYYLAIAHESTTAHELAVAVGQCWPIEACFETAKQETGLDDDEVWSWTVWHRHVALPMLAAVFLAAVRRSATSS